MTDGGSIRSFRAKATDFRDCANALEPDLMVLFDDAVDLLGSKDPTGIVVYHDHVHLTSRVPETLEEYIDGVHLLAKQFPHQLAMIMFDIKHEAATCANGLLIQ